MGAYVGPASINSALGEKIMLSVNSHNDCPFCTSLHGELARMAGIDEGALFPTTSCQSSWNIGAEINSQLAFSCSGNAGKFTDRQ
eukprot:5997938-Pyramimonas_sp.AAC.1